MNQAAVQEFWTREIEAEGLQTRQDVGKCRSKNGRSDQRDSLRDPSREVVNCSVPKSEAFRPNPGQLTTGGNALSKTHDAGTSGRATGTKSSPMAVLRTQK